MSATIRFKRGTRAQIDALALRGGLLEGEPLFITDEGRIAIALSESSYEAFAKESEAGGSTPSTSSADWSKLFLTFGG